MQLWVSDCDTCVITWVITYAAVSEWLWYLYNYLSDLPMQLWVSDFDSCVITWVITCAAVSEWVTLIPV